MTGFESRWLDLRESADHAARHKGLQAEAIACLKTVSDVRMVDLGCGTGSTFRALLPASTDWRWRLIDNDPLLLAEAFARHGSSGRIECVKSDLGSLADELFTGASLVTASALFDLVSEKFLARLVRILKSKSISLYTSLNYDGDLEWEIPLVMDAEIVAAFNAHQRRDKGFGAALGPSAREVLQHLFRVVDFDVTAVASPWMLGVAQIELQRQFIEGMARAVAETGLVESVAVESWRADRIGLIAKSDCKVGHWDMLARPRQ